jgi:polysaccharide export outer membrane protein
MQANNKRQQLTISRFSIPHHALSRNLTPPMAGLTLFAWLLLSATALPVRAQLPTLSPASPTGTSSAPTQTSYTLGGGDRIRIDIFNVPEYSGEAQVAADGTLNLPAIGSVSVTGLTLQAAQARLAERYARYVKRPRVTLSLVAPRPLKIAIAGEVQRPGSYSVPVAEGAQFPTVTQAITLAGGVTLSAAASQVQVRRSNGGQVFNVNLQSLAQSGNLSQDIPLRDGDEIFIPAATTIDPNATRQLADTSFAPDTSQPLKVAVVGEVVRPGPYSVTGAAAGATTADGTSGGGGNEPPTITQAIQVAGGITQFADIRQIQVRRVTRGGAQQAIAVNLWDILQSGDLSQDILLQEGDTIVVPKAATLSASEATELASASFSAATIQVNVVGEVNKPGVVQVPANAPLNQAVLAAGGFNNTRARKSSVELIRLQPNGTVEKRTVEVDLTAGVNDQTNPALRPNDVIVVNRSGLASFTDTLGTILSPLRAILGIF